MPSVVDLANKLYNSKTLDVLSPDERRFVLQNKSEVSREVLNLGSDDSDDSANILSDNILGMRGGKRTRRKKRTSRIVKSRRKKRASIKS
jgi:hypothetical protein